MDGQTDMIKSTVAFHNFANAPKNIPAPLIQKRSCQLLGYQFSLANLGHKTAFSCFHIVNRQLPTFSSIKTKNQGWGFALAVDSDVRDCFTSGYQINEEHRDATVVQLDGRERYCRSVLTKNKKNSLST